MGDAEVLLNARDLIACHEAWKLTLWAAVFTRTPLTREQVDQIVYPERCPIGLWLGSPASSSVRDRSEYAEVVENHDEFHQEMMQVASLLAKKDYQGAAGAVADGSAFVMSGRRLALSIVALNRVERIEVPA